jgi:hypothetical protein
MIKKSPSAKRGVLLLFVAILFAQCEKDDPSTEATIDPTMEVFTNSAVQGKLTIEQAYVQPLQLDFLAKRTDGNQFTFSQENSQEDKKVRLISPDGTPFSIPAQQGKYDPIEVTMTLQEDPYILKVTPGTDGNPPTVDYADFLANAKPSFVFSGKFTNRGESTRVYIALNIAEKLRINATQAGTTAVSLSKVNRAKFVFDPAFMLQDITTQDLESSVSFDYLGEKTILIHQAFNSGLYDDIIDRIFESAGAMKVEMIQVDVKG